MSEKKIIVIEAEHIDWLASVFEDSRRCPELLFKNCSFEGECIKSHRSCYNCWKEALEKNMYFACDEIKQYLETDPKGV